ncbi:MAG: flagellar basal body P-ring formation chaperone FlgA [Candidatus Cloacimonetes bacterium]|nr:flagellar basal body P-ring formation chaperone FlgA [Candidatus Cloacimonadota bacterium]
MKQTIVILLLLVAVQVNAITLNLKKVVKVTNEMVMVKHLVDSFEGYAEDYSEIEYIVIDTLPFEQRMANLASRDIQEKIIAQYPQIDVRIPSSIVAVRWAETKLDAEELKAEAEAFLRIGYDLSDEAVITFQNIPSVTVPDNKIRLSFETARTPDNSKYTKVICRAENNQNFVHIFSFNVQIEDFQTVYKAKRSIKKDEVIDLNDFTQVQARVNPVNMLISEISITDNLIAKRFITKDAILQKSDVAPLPDVKTNEDVTVVVQTNSMQMSYQALSKVNGWLGDRVMVQNPDSKKIFYAEVIDKNKVKIDLEDK